MKGLGLKGRQVFPKSPHLGVFRLDAVVAAYEFLVGQHVKMRVCVDRLPHVRESGGQVSALKPQRVRRWRRRVQAWEVGRPSFVRGNSL